MKTTGGSAGPSGWTRKNWSSATRYTAPMSGWSPRPTRARVLSESFLDPVKKAVGCSHAGWKGTAASIGRRTVEAMTRAYGSDPGDILACIAPSIGPCCYEVDEPLRKAFTSIPDVDPEGLLVDKGNGKYMLNLWEANRRILLAAGLRPQHITVAEVCTCCHADVFHSHRATAGNRGSLAAVIALAE